MGKYVSYGMSRIDTEEWGSLDKRPELPSGETGEKFDHEHNKGPATEYERMLSQLDESKITCFVCKESLKRVRPIEQSREKVGNIEPGEVIFECRRGHVFTGRLLLYLYLTEF